MLTLLPRSIGKGKGKFSWFRLTSQNLDVVAGYLRELASNRTTFVFLGESLVVLQIVSVLNLLAFFVVVRSEISEQV